MSVDNFTEKLMELICAGKLEEADTFVKSNKDLRPDTLAVWNKTMTEVLDKKKQGYVVVGLSKQQPKNLYIHEMSNTVH